MWRPRINRKQQPNNWQCRTFTQTSSIISSAIRDKIGCVQPQSTYTKALRGCYKFVITMLSKKSSRNYCIKWQRSETSILEKWSPLILAHNRSQVMEVRRIGFSYRTQKQKTCLSSWRRKKYFTEKSTSLLNRMNTTKKMLEIFFCDRSIKNKILEENCTKTCEEITIEFTSPGTHQKNGLIE